MNLRKKMKNAGLWAAVFALILISLQLFDIQLAPEKYDSLLQWFNVLLIALGFLGIVSNPESGKWYLDKLMKGESINKKKK